MLIRYIPNATKHKWVICFPPLILAINICEAVFRDFEAYSFHAFSGEKINNLWVMSGPWNIMNGIAGILNILLITVFPIIREYPKVCVNLQTDVR